jgi:hypothetical protein
MDDNISIKYGGKSLDIQAVSQRHLDKVNSKHKSREKYKVKALEERLTIADIRQSCWVNLLYGGIVDHYWSDSVYRITKHRTPSGQVIAFNSRNERVYLNPDYEYRVIEII